MRWIKRVTLIILAGILLCLGGCQKSLEDQIQEQLELGQRYLTESAYEEAIVAFSKVIELDAKNVPAYIGLGQVYEKQAEQAADAEKAAELYDLAVENYEKVRELEPENIQAYDSLTMLYRELMDFDKLFQMINEDSPDSEKQEVTDIKETVSLLKQLKQLCEQRKYDEIRTALADGEYEKLNAFAEDRKLIIPLDNGQGIGIYIFNETVTMIYYGDYQDGMRQGQGVWISDHSCAEGEWSQDVPNGYQDDKHYEGNRLIVENKGTVKNGLWDGVCMEGFYYQYRDEWLEGEVSFTNGHYNVIEVSDGHSIRFRSGRVSIDLGDPSLVHGIDGFIRR